MAPRITSAHSFTDGAIVFRDYARGLNGVTAISPGEISVASSAGLRRVKVSDETGSVLLQVRSGKTIQDVRIYVKPNFRHSIKLSLARFIRDNDYKLTFK